MISKSSIEISVHQASEALDVTSRTILNYIKSKEIEAIKVGKSWFIKEPSFRAFVQKYKLNIDESRLEGVANFDVVASKDQNKEASEVTSSKRSKYIVNTLKLYQIACKALCSNKWKDLEKSVGHTLILNKIIGLKLQALELIGAGYYSFDRKEKKSLYCQSRQRVGGILSLFYSDESLRSEWKAEIDFIENQLLGAYSSLIRKMEKKSEGK